MKYDAKSEKKSSDRKSVKSRNTKLSGKKK